MLSTKQKKNPFYEPPLQKAFYYPSPETHIKTTEKLNNLMPEQLSDEGPTRTPNEQDFLSGSHTFLPGAPLPTATGSPQDNSGKFDESWPTSEKPSALSVAGISPSAASAQDDHISILMSKLSELDDIKSQLSFEPGLKSDRHGQSLLSQEKESTLAKYIDRFRHGKPMSREEREKAHSAKQREFWWLNSEPQPSDSSTPKSDRDFRGKERSQRSRSPPSPYSYQGNKSTISKISHKRSPSPHDERTSKLQERAEQLLERTASSLNSTEPAVSTEGLGSTWSSSTVEERPYRPKFTEWRDREMHNTILPAKPLKPEDDILHQYRVRRRMELARAKIAPKGLGQKAQSDVVETRLAEFRERLAQATLTGEAELENSTHFHGFSAESTGVPKEQPKANKDKEKEVPQAGEPEVEPTPASLASTPPRKHVIHGHVVRSPVASPSVQRKAASDAQAGVEPHLHLECDLLPCPHRHEQLDHLYFRSKSTSSCGHHHGDCCRPHSTKHRHHKVTEEPARQSVSTDNDTDSDFETYKQKHLRSLQKEIEESLASSESGSQRNRNRSKIQKSLRQTGGHKRSPEEYELYSSEEVPERDTECEGDKRGAVRERREQGTDNVRRDHSKQRKRGEQAGDEVSDKTEEEHVGNRHSPTRGHKSKQNDNLRHKKQLSEESDVRFVRESRKGKPEQGGRDVRHKGSHDGPSRERYEGRDSDVNVKHRPSRQGQLKGSEQEQPGTSQTGPGHPGDYPPDNDAVHSRGFPQPKFQSSPKSYKLSSTIGQVVTEHLFVASSAEDFVGADDTALSEPEEQAAGPPEHPLEMNISPISDIPVRVEMTAFEALDISEEEEFTEDEILIDLRKRREKYLKKIKEINTIIDEKS